MAYPSGPDMIDLTVTYSASEASDSASIIHGHATIEQYKCRYGLHVLD